MSKPVAFAHLPELVLAHRPSSDCCGLKKTAAVELFSRSSAPVPPASLRQAVAVTPREEATGSSERGLGGAGSRLVGARDSGLTVTAMRWQRGLGAATAAALTVTAMPWQSLHGSRRSSALVGAG